MTRSVFASLGFCLFAAIQCGAVAAADKATCGGIAGKKCSASNEYCAVAPGKCQVADVAGTCEKKPELCPAIVLPVCGCDKKTYNNACEAARAGISVDFTGKCEKTAK